jgi:hypothetical protein
LKEGTFAAVMDCKFDHGMRVVKYDGWDNKGNFTSVFKFVSPQGNKFDIGSRSLSKDLRNLTSKDLSEAFESGRFSPVKNSQDVAKSKVGKSTAPIGLSINEFQNLLESPSKAFVDKLKEVAGVSASQKDGGELVTNGYTIKYDKDNNVSIFRGDIGGKQKRVLRSEKDFDSVLFGVVNDVMTKSIAKSDIKPSTKVLSASAQKLTGSTFGLYH